MTHTLSHDRPLRDPQPADNLILWLPVFLSGGIGAYFLSAGEPSVWWGIGGLLVSVLGAMASFRWRYVPVWRWAVVFGVAFSLGMILMQYRAHSVTTHLLDRNLWGAEITGKIQSFERAGAGWRLVIEDAHLTRAPDYHHKTARTDPQTYVFRLTMRQKGFTPDVGGALHIKAGLMPPSSPLVPGSYDFRRHAFFQGIGAYGYVTKILDYQPPQISQKQDANYLETYRDWLTEKVYRVLPQPEAGIVTAMLNGQRAGISRQTTTTLQQSGLQHVISISGLHVGLMAVTIFYVMRLLMALNMHVALHYPIKKIAAGFALGGIVFYLLIVGNSPPTLRSVIMSGIALIAIMLDREPIQMRVVALSGILILLIQPESLVDIGFQMSFAAVIGMVAFFQQTKFFWTHARWQESWLLKPVRGVLMVVATSVIATMVTAPLVILYFQQIPLLSMLSNVLATLPISFLIMPGTFLSYLFTPIPGLGELAIRMMGLGVTWMMDVAWFVAKLPSAVFQAQPVPLLSVGLLMIGVYTMIVMKNRWRWSGLGVLGAGLLLVPFHAHPDLLMIQSRVILSPDPDSDRLFIEGRLGGFEKNLMLQWTAKKKAVPFPCESDICDVQIAKRNIRIVRTVEALPRACDGNPDLVLTRYYLDQKCRNGRVIDRHDLDRQGGQAIYLEDGRDIRVETVLDPIHRRLWQEAAPVDKVWHRR